jgi:S-adenosylmethionine synthetase
VKHSEIKDFLISEVIPQELPTELLKKETEFLINPTGRFVVGGPQGDTGLPDAKSSSILWRHGPARRRRLFGQGPLKSRSQRRVYGAWVAKNVVAAGLATSCEVQFAYAIGHPDPVSVHIDTFGTAKGR